MFEVINKKLPVAEFHRSIFAAQTGKQNEKNYFTMLSNELWAFFVRTING